MLLHEVRDRPKAQELVDRIQKSQDYLLQLYEGVRNYAAPIHLERARIDLSELARNVWNDIEPTRHRPNARLILLSDDVDPHCYADSLRISQVFRNLFENSLAAAGDDCEVTLSFADGDLDGRPALVVAVQDNGPGISADHHHQIFQPFFTTKTRGSGLGLAISKRLAEAHGGRIRLDSNAKHGARFEIALPRTRPAEPHV
jgi:signal transduction histidine kinase